MELAEPKRKPLIGHTRSVSKASLNKPQSTKNQNSKKFFVVNGTNNPAGDIEESNVGESMDNKKMASPTSFVAAMSKDTDTDAGGDDEKQN